MIAELRGIVSALHGVVAILDVNGVGYEVICSKFLSESLETGSEQRIVIYTDVKEDHIRLFGFVDRLEKEVFLLLLKVKGVGAKSALDIVSQMEKREVLRAVGDGDVGRLQGLRGIGKKTAERIVLELKDRVSEFATSRRELSEQVETIVTEPFGDAIEALQVLGFTRRDAERAVSQVQTSNGGLTDSGAVVREALRFV